METISVEGLMLEARRQTGLMDFGPERFIEPLTVLVDSITREAALTERGMAAQRARLVNSLANRLRKRALLAAHPEILQENVQVAFAIVSLPRTGSTMLQRLLGASPRLTATRWWEAIFPLPMPGEARGENHVRVAQAEALIRQITDAAGGLAAIHPMDPHAHDEDLLVVEQSFVSTMAEAMMYVPSYGQYVLTADAGWVYDELAEYLQILQWQSNERQGAHAGRRWVLKSPNHLLHVPVILRRFPECVIVMTHRDICQVMGSWYSMAEQLRLADSAADRMAENVAHWNMRWRAGMDAVRAARQAHPERFFDVAYRDLLVAPLDVVGEIHARGAVPFGAAEHAAVQGWMDANPRDGRPSHRYSLAQFGETEAAIRALFPEEEAGYAEKTG